VDYTVENIYHFFARNLSFFFCPLPIISADKFQQEENSLREVASHLFLLLAKVRR
jgi:hypothetical protein